MSATRSKQSIAVSKLPLMRLTAQMAMINISERDKVQEGEVGPVCRCSVGSGRTYGETGVREPDVRLER